MKPGIKDKQAKFGAYPHLSTIPRTEKTPDETLRLEFRAGKMDMEGKWGWSNFEIDCIKQFLEKFFEIQKLTWQELGKSGSHPISFDKIVPQALKRLQELELDDCEYLYSIRMTGKSRLWGLRDQNIFWILWWDPNHEICPSHKKNT